jgi:pimeloyl-ACP methyl ester carboxylesterase
MRFRRRAPVVPPWVPPASITHVEGRGEMFYRRHDGGEPGQPTLLLLHGWTASADLQWFTSYRALGERYPYLAVDHRGHGRGIRSDEAFTLEDAADDAIALVRQLGIDDVIVVGYSMGGPLSLLAAQRHPETVSGMVLAATAMEFQSHGERLQWWFLTVLESVLRSRSWRWFGRRALMRLERGQPELSQWMPWISAEGQRGDPSEITQAGRALRHFDARPFASRLGKPAASLITTNDRMVTLRKQQALAAAVGASVREVEGDHFAFLSKGDAFAQVLRASVDDVVSRRLPAPAVDRRVATPGAPVPS